MGSIHRTYDYGSGGTKCFELIRCVDDWEPKTHEIWCLSSDGIIHEVHMKAQLEVGTGAMGKFMTN